jgi:hypothetical protein
MPLPSWALEVLADILQSILRRAHVGRYHRIFCTQELVMRV